MADVFRKFAQTTAYIVGHPWSFVVAVVIITTWAVLGLLLAFPDRWLLFINTLATVTTFLIVFIIQNTQNRDARAVHLKLDELIRSTKQARNAIVNIEDVSEEELNHLEQEFTELRQKYLRKKKKE